MDKKKKKFLMSGLQRVIQGTAQLEHRAEVKFSMVKAFFMARPETFLEIYQRVNGTSKLTAGGWKKYVNSRELHDLVYNKLVTLSAFSREVVAYSELADDYGDEIHTDDGEIFIALPLLPHPVPKLAESLAKKGIKATDEGEYPLVDALNQIATRAFITSLNHLAFAEMYKKPFRILKKESGWFKLDKKLDYKAIS